MSRLNIDRDYQVVDGTEPVVFTSKTANEEKDYPVSHALRESIRTQSSGGDWLLSDKQTFWNVWKVELDVEPKIRDVITDAKGHSWTIMDVALETFDTVWRMLCEKER